MFNCAILSKYEFLRQSARRQIKMGLFFPFKLLKKENEPFSTAERSERVENFLFRATREYTEAGIEQATVAMRYLGADSPEPRRRAVPG